MVERIEVTQDIEPTEVGEIISQQHNILCTTDEEGFASFKL